MSNFNTDNDNDEQEKPTKSQLKMDMQSLQKVGEALVKLSDAELNKIPLPDNLLEAVVHARSLPANESKRRQLQYIGKLMRHVDSQPIEAALNKLKYSHQEETVKFHAAEKWREELITHGDNALQKFMQLYPQVERQALRTLIRNAQSDRKHDKKSGAEIELFRFIREFLT